eukprot:jgi/Undpi1/11206/HiC_scaffold_30.g13504.m1
MEQADDGSWAGRVLQGGGFEPYADNGGTVVAVAGRDYCIIAADSRLSDGYAILTRNVTRVHRLSGDTHLATAGCWADTQGLLRLLQYLIRDYESQQRRTMGVKAMSHMLSTHLYYRRSFPFYTFNILGGLDDEGTGAVYGYDAVGSFERVRVACAGGGQSIMQPVLDRLDAEAGQGAGGNGELPIVAVELEVALSLVRRAFVAAGERNIRLGDRVEILVLTREVAVAEKAATSAGSSSKAFASSRANGERSEATTTQTPPHCTYDKCDKPVGHWESTCLQKARDIKSRHFQSATGRIPPGQLSPFPPPPP